MMSRARATGASGPIPSAAIIVIASLLIGLAVGALVSSLSGARTAPRVTDADYAVMVADLYAHEKSVFNARERLEPFGDPLTIMRSATDTYAQEKPESTAEIESLAQLTRALEEQLATEPAPPATQGIMTLLILVVASVALAAGAAWIWKQAETRGLRVPRLPTTEAARSFKMPTLSRRPNAVPVTVNATMPQAPPASERTEGQWARSPSTRTAARPLNTPAVAVASRRVTAPVLAQPTILAEFESEYELGDDPYDEVHTILNARGEVIGRCGLSATEPSERPGRYFGFTAWVQENSGDGDFAAVGIVGAPARTARAAALAEWRRRGTISAVEAAEHGLRMAMETRTMLVRVTVADFDYPQPPEGSSGYFGRLSVRFQVEPVG